MACGLIPVYWTRESQEVIDVQLHSRTADIQISGIRKFTELVKRYPDAISLTIGQPHFPTPQHIREAAQRAIAEGYTVYTPNRGELALRQAVAAYYQRLLGHDYQPDSEILVTVGATHALDIAMRTLLQPGDEVIVPAPAYPGYEGIVTLMGAKTVYVDTARDGFRLTPEALAGALSARSKILILASPANPTGVQYSRADVEALASVLRGTDVWVISDEIYAELSFAKEPVTSIATVDGMRERTVVIQGLSKSHSMTGWRIGFTLAPANLTDEFVKVLQYSVTCASSVSQHAALEAMRHGADDARPMREAYRRNRDRVVETFRRLGIPLVEPTGAFYAFPHIAAALGMDSQTLCDRLLSEARVAIIPGDAFGPHGEGYARLSYACDEGVLDEALRRIETFVQSRM